MKKLTTIKDTNFAIILVYLMTLFIALSIQLISLLVIDQDGLSEPGLITFSAMMNFIAYAIQAGVLIHIFKTFLFKNQWVLFKHHLRFSIYLIMIALYLMFTFLVLAQGFFLMTDTDPISPNQAVLEAIMESGVWYNVLSLFIIAVILAPIVEELVYRKAIYGLIQQYAHPVFAVLGSAFLFALIHVVIDLGNAIYIVPYFGLGLVLAFIYYYSGRMLFVSIFAHALMNLYTFILLFSNL